jgi:hypothetical protein
MLDEVVLQRLLGSVGGTLANVYPAGSKNRLLANLVGYSNAARFSPWVVLVDLDRDCDCAPPCRDRWLPTRSAHLCFRIAVRAVEAWLMADRERIAQLLRVSVARVPSSPDHVEDPKLELVSLARKSRSSSIRREMVPTSSSCRRVGPLYVQNMIRFVEDRSTGWRPEIAAEHSDSLRRCIRALGGLVRNRSGE